MERRLRGQKLTNLGYQQLTVSNTAVKLTMPTGRAYGDVVGALINCQDAQIRWRDDGTAPTSTVGMVMNAGENLEYDGDLQNFQAIRTSTDAKLNISYFG